MSRVVFLLEEYSMKVLLEGLLPRMFPALRFLCISHEGKQDLEKSIPRKLKAWNEPGVRFIVLRDNDGGDCRTLKERLVQRCRDTGRSNWLVRIACQELEAWYLAEPAAMAEAFNNESLRAIGSKARFRNPDKIRKPSDEIRKIVPSFQKVSGARVMAATLSSSRNCSGSFLALMNAIARVDREFEKELQIQDRDTENKIE